MPVNWVRDEEEAKKSPFKRHLLLALAAALIAFCTTLLVHR